MIFEKPIDSFCALFGHNYKFVEKIDTDTSELECKCCKNHFIQNKKDAIVNITINKDIDSFSNYFKNGKASSKFNQFIGFL